MPPPNPNPMIFCQKALCCGESERFDDVYRLQCFTILFSCNTGRLLAISVNIISKNIFSCVSVLWIKFRIWLMWTHIKVFFAFKRAYIRIFMSNSPPFLWCGQKLKGSVFHCKRLANFFPIIYIILTLFYQEEEVFHYKWSHETSESILYGIFNFIGFLSQDNVKNFYFILYTLFVSNKLFDLFRFLFLKICCIFICNMNSFVCSNDIGIAKRKWKTCLTKSNQYFDCRDKIHFLVFFSSFLSGFEFFTFCLLCSVNKGEN